MKRFKFQSKVEQESGFKNIIYTVLFEIGQLGEKCMIKDFFYLGKLQFRKGDERKGISRFDRNL